MIDLDAIKARLAECKQASPLWYAYFAPLLMQDVETLIEELETLRDKIEQEHWFAVKEEE